MKDIPYKEHLQILEALQLQHNYNTMELHENYKAALVAVKSSSDLVSEANEELAKKYLTLQKRYKNLLKKQKKHTHANSTKTKTQTKEKSTKNSSTSQDTTTQG